MSHSVPAPAAAVVRTMAAALSGARAGIGIALFIAPGRSLRIVGLGRLDAESRFFLRCFTVREVSVAAPVLAECRRGSPGLLRINAATDLAEGLGLIAAAGGSRSMRRTAAVGVPSSLEVTLAWCWLRRGRATLDS